MEIPEVFQIKIRDYPNLSAALGTRIDKLNAERPVPFKNLNEYVLHLMIRDCKL